MGLAEPKRRKKLTPSNHGPSAWSKAAPNSSVGFKLMASMGWAPGQGLGNDLQGEKDNIKYSLKDDLLGIGAKKEFGGGVWRGMGEVDDLYRRLDVGGSPKPPTEEVTKVIEVKEEVKLRGGWKMNFQVGDTYKSSFSREESEVEGESSTPESSESRSDGTSEKKSKKRKRDDEDSEKKSSKKEKSESKTKKSKKDKKEKPVSTEKVKKSKSLKDEPKISKATKGKSKKDGNESKTAANAKSSSASEAETDATVNGTDDIAKERKSKKDRSNKKEEKSSSKDKKEKKGKSLKKEKKEKKEKSKKKASDSNDIVNSVSVTPSTLTSNTTGADTSVAETDPVPRYMHRSRYLAMKRASAMDPSALREILGVKG
jgi:Pin2-interacting protein X1